MICTAPPSHRATTTARQTVAERQGQPPTQMQPSETPLLDWIAGELREYEGEPALHPRDHARRILEQAFATVG